MPTPMPVSQCLSRARTGREEPFDYGGVDEVLDHIVLVAGPSLRRPASRPVGFTGRKYYPGHNSPWRLEGNKVVFSRLDDAHKEAILHDANELVEVGNEVQIERLPRDQQLAYWINLHNMLVISEIVKRYPVREPRRLEYGPDGVLFHDAPLATIRGVPLSLRDIRVGIVYRYWPDARVLYGFFHGDLASPSIRARAYTVSSVWDDLENNALEFVNALRGVHRSEDVMRVSPMYQEARERLFPDWPDDLREHLSRYAEAPVQEILRSTQRVAIGRYARRTADLVGGTPFNFTSAVAGVGGWGPGQSPTYVLMMQEFGRKFRELRRAGRYGNVTITDLPSRTPPESDDSSDDAKND